MKRKLLTVCLLLSFLAAMASNDGVNALLIHGKSGAKTTILLDEKPVVSFQGEDFVITTHMNVINYASADVLKFSYVSVDPAGVNNPGIPGAVFSFDKDLVRMENLPPHTHVAVYTTDGKQVSSATTDSKGFASLLLSEPATAVYVIKTSSSTFKISRP